MDAPRVGAQGGGAFDGSQHGLHHRRSSSTPMHHPGTDWLSSCLPEGLTASLARRKWTSAQRRTLRRAIDSAKAFRDRAQKENDEAFNASLLLSQGGAHRNTQPDHSRTSGRGGCGAHRHAAQETLNLERAVLQRGMIRCDLLLPQAQPSVTLTNLLKGHRIPTPYVERIANEATPGGGDGFVRILEDILEAARHADEAEGATGQHSNHDSALGGSAALQLAMGRHGGGGLNVVGQHGTPSCGGGGGATADDDDATVLSEADLSAFLGVLWNTEPSPPPPVATQKYHALPPPPTTKGSAAVSGVVSPTSSMRRLPVGGDDRELFHYQLPTSPTSKTASVSPIRRGRMPPVDPEDDGGDPNTEWGSRLASPPNVDDGLGAWVSQVQQQDTNFTRPSSTGDPGLHETWAERHAQRIDELAKRTERCVSPETASLPRQRAMLHRMARLIEDGKRQLAPDRLIEKAYRAERASLSSMRQSPRPHQHHAYHRYGAGGGLAKSVDASVLAAAEELVSMMDNKKRLLRRLRGQRLLEPLSPRAATVVDTSHGGYVALSREERGRCAHAWKDNPNYMWLEEEPIRQLAEAARARRELGGTSGKAPLSRAPQSRYASFAGGTLPPRNNASRSSFVAGASVAGLEVDDDASTLDWTVSGPVLRSDAEQQYAAIQLMKERQHQCYSTIASAARRRLSPPIRRHLGTLSPVGVKGSAPLPPAPLDDRRGHCGDLVVVDGEALSGPSDGRGASGAPTTAKGTSTQLSDRLQKLSVPRVRASAVGGGASTVEAHAQALRQRRKEEQQAQEASRHVTIPVFMNIAAFA